MEAVIVVPTYNEAENIEILLERIFALELDLHVLIVDDSSPDDTALIVERLQKDNPRLHLLRRKGPRSFGASYKEGFDYALGLNPKYVFQMDADLSHPPESIPDFLEAMPDHDLLIGSRYAGGVRVVNWSISRLLLSLGANTYIKLILRTPVEDCTSGFRCWKAQSLAGIPMVRVASNGYAFLVEMAFIAFRKCYSVGEVPIVFVERKQGASKMSKRLIFESALLPWKLIVRNSLRKFSSGDADELSEICNGRKA